MWFQSKIFFFQFIYFIESLILWNNRLGLMFRWNILSFDKSCWLVISFLFVCTNLLWNTLYNINVSQIFWDNPSVDWTSHGYPWWDFCSDFKCSWLQVNKKNGGKTKISLFKPGCNFPEWSWTWELELPSQDFNPWDYKRYI